MIVSGIGASSLSEARAAVEKGHKSCLTSAELGMGQLLMPRSKEPLYLDVRQWLTQYAKSHADQSPISGEALLPSGRKEFYYAQYEHERRCRQRLCASRPCFNKAWRIELPWLKVARSICKFVKCGLCEYLREQINLCARTH